MSEKKYTKKLVVELLNDIELVQSLVNEVQTGSKDMQALNKVINILSKIKDEVEKLDGVFIDPETWDEIKGNYDKYTERWAELKEEQEEIEQELAGDFRWLNYAVNNDDIKMD